MSTGIAQPTRTATTWPVLIMRSPPGSDDSARCGSTCMQAAYRKVPPLASSHSATAVLLDSPGTATCRKFACLRTCTVLPYFPAAWFLSSYTLPCGLVRHLSWKHPNNACDCCSFKPLSTANWLRLSRDFGLWILSTNSWISRAAENTARIRSKRHFGDGMWSPSKMMSVPAASR